MMPHKHPVRVPAFSKCACLYSERLHFLMLTDSSVPRQRSSGEGPGPAASNLKQELQRVGLATSVSTSLQVIPRHTNTWKLPYYTIASIMCLCVCTCVCVCVCVCVWVWCISSPNSVRSGARSFFDHPTSCPLLLCTSQLWHWLTASRSLITSTPQFNHP